MTVIEVTFGEHIAHNRITSMVSSIAAYGSVFPSDDPRTFRCEVFRASKLPKLREQLTQ